MRSAALSALLAACVTPLAYAQSPTTRPDADATPDIVTVWGIREAEVGKAYSASEGEVDFGKFVDRPLLRVGELAEVVPGLAATQHSGTGKANQYFLRGFNLDHGTDFSISLDGIPLNLRTNAHGQGYLDINFLIPEIVERITYRKGVYAAENGDFSAAGSAGFSTFKHLPENFGQVEIGENNWRRFVGGVNVGNAGYVALDLTSDDGPWVKPEDLKKANIFARFASGPWSISGGAYQADWNATDQIPLRAVEAGSLDRLADIDPDVGGRSSREWVNGGYADDAGLSAHAYAMHYKLRLVSDFTYFLDDPVNGDEFKQEEERVTFGGSAAKTFAPIGAWTPRVGLEARFDRIDPVGLYRTTAGATRETVREDSVDQDSAGVWASADGDFGRARINLGLRADVMRVDVSSDTAANSGKADDAILSPKASFAWRFTDDLEGYVSAGRGFHSNDARGATIAIDSASGDPASPVPLLVRADGVEAGMRWERPGLSATASIFGLDLASELVYVGDAGATEASSASRRTGFEVMATWSPTDWLTLDGAAASTRGRFRDVAAGQDRIPSAVEYVLTGGATVRVGEDWTGTLTVRHLGEAPLIEDNSARSETSTVVNGRLAWKIGNIVLAAEALNLLDSNDADITYFYASRLPGEAADGIEDIHFHPIPPRSLRLQARINF
ncbi:MAG: TonB-dependent receptor [Burkholderiales bacterium]|nr:MAG: TonB-dependent receptor [Burkholderiales bacterium]